MRARPLLVLAAVVLSACGSPKADKRKAPPLPPTSGGEGAVHVGTGEVSAEVKKAVSEQLECPVEQLSVLCTERDRSGECIAVRGLGCEREIEYKFGSD
jgi:hypothetical protein